MQTLNWLETHIGSIDDGVTLINRFHWSLAIIQTELSGTLYWYVKAGEKVIFSADSRDAVNAFIYGMSLSYSTLAILPESLFDQVMQVFHDAE